MRAFNRVIQLIESVSQKKHEATEKVTHNDVLILDKDGSMRLNYQNEKVQKNIQAHLKSLENIHLKAR